MSDRDKLIAEHNELFDFSEGIAKKLKNAEEELDRVLRLVDKIYSSGDYSRLTEPLLREILGLEVDE